MEKGKLYETIHRDSKPSGEIHTKVHRVDNPEQELWLGSKNLVRCVGHNGSNPLIVLVSDGEESAGKWEVEPKFHNDFQDPT